MIVGTGMLAKAMDAFADSSDVLVIASGVANSQEREPAAFAREKDLFLTSIAKHPGEIIYFGTASIDDPLMKGSPYLAHKSEMESLVRSAGRQFRIFRLSQVVGNSANPHTIVEHFFQSIVESQPVNVWANTVRYLVDVEDVAALVRFVVGEGIRKNETITLVPPFGLSPLEIVRCLEDLTSLTAECTVEPKGRTYKPDSAAFLELADATGMKVHSSYAKNVIRKYYGGRV